ncbi:MAG: LytTR family transcriptional regulator, partial [Flavobacteriales bacterium]|nr:LytTR family transcriptional regulator [Flavobacteriales bacterium]
KDGNFFLQISIDDIAVLQSEGNYLIIKSGNKEYRYRTTIKKILEILPTDKFIQTHRAFIIQKKFVVKHSSLTVTVGATEIPISQGKKDEVLAKLNAISKFKTGAR